MKVGDMVKHYDGDKGLVIAFQEGSPYPYLVWFFGDSKAGKDWFVKSVFRVISESR